MARYPLRPRGSARRRSGIGELVWRGKASVGDFLSAALATVLVCWLGGAPHREPDETSSEVPFGHGLDRRGPYGYTVRLRCLSACLHSATALDATLHAASD